MPRLVVSVASTDVLHSSHSRRKNRAITQAGRAILLNCCASEPCQWQVPPTHANSRNKTRKAIGSIWLTCSSADRKECGWEFRRGPPSSIEKTLNFQDSDSEVMILRRLAWAAAEVVKREGAETLPVVEPKCKKRKAWKKVYIFYQIYPSKHKRPRVPYIAI